MDDKREKRFRAAMIVGGWTLFGLFFASQAYLGQALFGRGASWGQALLVWMPCAFSWGLLTPGMLYLARRFQFRRKGWLLPLTVHLIAASLCSSVALVVYLLVRGLLVGSESSGRSPFMTFKHLLVAEFHTGIIIYGTVIGISYALDYYRKYRERELQAAQLESRLAQAQLDALRKQLQPHFLFNTLNTVAILMDEDTKAARDMLVRLSDLLRATLDRSKGHEVTLRQELEFIEGYLEIERTRFHDRLTVHVDVDPKTLNARVPDLILQPIVENAIRHGIAPRSTAGLIEIRAARLNGSLHLQVRDNGSGWSGNGVVVGKGRNGNGVGIANTRARLAQLYGVDHSFEMRDADGGGLCVDITLPFRAAPPAANIASTEDAAELGDTAGVGDNDEDSRPDR